jgi:hypothetical protein
VVGGFPNFNRMFTHSYALFMGLARWHLLFGSQFRNLAVRHKWAPVTTCEVINYRTRSSGGRLSWQWWRA